MTETINKISRILFYILLLILPLNLGLHFTLTQSYVNGILIDYLVPTLYLQDIVVFIIVVLNIKKIMGSLTKKNRYLVWFLFAVLLSVLGSAHFLISLTAFMRLLLYVALMLFINVTFEYKKDFLTITKFLAVSALLLSCLALLQWRNQGSVFNNYLFFGEQPYTAATPGINLENYFGLTRVPPYGTFRHPNVLAGFLVLILILALGQINKSAFLKFVFVIGIVTLFFTLSKFAWISFLLSIIFWFLIKQRSKAVTWVIGVFFIILALSFTLPFFRNFSLVKDQPSFYRRADLLEASYRMVKIRPLFGVGFDNSTAYIDRFLPLQKDLRFTQPPHNIFVLILVESGIFAFITFLLFFVGKLKEAKAKPLLLAALLQILFLGSFDHYFITMHQTDLLFWIILAFV